MKIRTKIKIFVTMVILVGTYLTLQLYPSITTTAIQNEAAVMQVENSNEAYVVADTAFRMTRKLPLAIYGTSAILLMFLWWPAPKCDCLPSKSE